MTLVQNVFYLITPSRTFTFRGKDPDEKEGWMYDLNRCISNSSDNTQVKKGDRIDVTILGSEVRTDAKEKVIRSLFVLELGRSFVSYTFISSRTQRTSFWWKISLLASPKKCIAAIPSLTS